MGYWSYYTRSFVWERPLCPCPRDHGSLSSHPNSVYECECVIDCALVCIVIVCARPYERIVIDFAITLRFVDNILSHYLAHTNAYTVGKTQNTKHN
jgi:hypothetical protein